jgi:hypothetical protein
MNTSELHALFQAEERAVQLALFEHRLLNADPYLARLNSERLKDFPPILRDVIAMSGDALSDALRKHLANGEDPDATPVNYGGTAFRRCFGEGKLEAMRILLSAGAKTKWTADQISITLGKVPPSPATGTDDPFVFACRVGNLEAARLNYQNSDAGHQKHPDAITGAVKARATDVVAWLLEEGFDSNAVDDINWGALERAVDNEDIGTAEVLLAAGAEPFGSSEKDYSSPVEKAVSEQMRALFVRFGVNPARFEYDINPENLRLSFLPEKALTQEEFVSHRSQRAGQANPERFLPTFWYEQMRTGRYSAPKDIENENNRAQPVWSFSRVGRSATPIPDGRLVFIGGEHEDHYDPDFCIYADVTVLDGKGRVDHFIYSEEVFPPTDFHTATLHGDQIWLIGSLSYPELRQEGLTQVLILDLSDFSIHPVETSGDAPGWISRHRAVLDADNIILTGGKIDPGYRDNEQMYFLDLKTFCWKKERLRR